MTDYLTLKSVLERDLYARESAPPLTDDLLRSYLLLRDRPTERVCLFFHGFTAGPYQFIPLAQTLHKAGYNVLVPLLPGHGIGGIWGPTNPPPLTDDPHEYLKFGLRWLKLAQQCGEKVIVGGLSAGGTLAGWLALEKADAIDRAILYAPYFSASRRVIDLFVKCIDTYIQWEKPLGPSYPGFQVGALRAVLRIADYMAKKVEQGPLAPTFVISSESDRAVSNLDHYRFFQQGLGHQPRCWYHRFDRVLDIPHTMMTAAEGNRYTSLLGVMTKAFIESDLTWDEVEEIGYRMSQRRPFHSVVSDLGWQAKVSPDMPAMMTLVDKWAIAVSRKMSDLQRRRLAQLDR